MTNWKAGLFGCFDDCGLCILTYLVPCVTFGQTAEAAEMGTCALYGFLFMVPIVNLVMAIRTRGKVRDSRGIAGSGVGDCCAVWLCPLCALVQMAKEVREPVPQIIVRSEQGEAVQQ